MPALTAIAMTAAAITTIASLPATLAQSTVLHTMRAGPTSLPFDMVASVVDAAPDQTTFALQCPSAASSEPVCPLPSPVTLTEGPSAASISIVSSLASSGMHAAITVRQDCTLSSTSLPSAASPSATTALADCFWSYRLDVTAADGISHASHQASRTQLVGSQVSYAPLTVTAGVHKLRAPKATQTADGALAGAGAGAGSGLWGAAGAAVLAAGMF